MAVPLQIIWQPHSEERYCVDSGKPVSLIPGDRCVSHGDRREMCYTALRDPRCQHPRRSENHPYPRCEECGCVGTLIEHSTTVTFKSETEDLDGFSQ